MFLRLFLSEKKECIILVNSQCMCCRVKVTVLCVYVCVNNYYFVNMLAPYIPCLYIEILWCHNNNVWLLLKGLCSTVMDRCPESCLLTALPAAFLWFGQKTTMASFQFGGCVNSAIAPKTTDHKIINNSKLAKCCPCTCTQILCVLCNCVQFTFLWLLHMWLY